MSFRSSLRLFRRWTEDCDTKLMESYNKYGPAWSILASQLPGRSGKECRKRWLSLSGTLEAERYEADKQLWIDGYEKMTMEDGKSGWIKVHDLEKIPENPFERISKYLPTFKASWLKKKSGWSEIELMALREGYEQFILPTKQESGEHESIWNRIAKKFSRRTGTQCRNYFYKQHIFWNSEEKLKQVFQEIDNNQNIVEERINVHINQ